MPSIHHAERERHACVSRRAAHRWPCGFSLPKARPWVKHSWECWKPQQWVSRQQQSPLSRPPWARECLPKSFPRSSFSRRQPGRNQIGSKKGRRPETIIRPCQTTGLRSDKLALPPSIHFPWAWFKRVEGTLIFWVHSHILARKYGGRWSGFHTRCGTGQVRTQVASYQMAMQPCQFWLPVVLQAVHCPRNCS